jgi:glycosyltransferase involved in cell wall biosynthesis
VPSEPAPSRPLRVCVVCSRHSLDDARVVHKEAESLRAAGHEVILLFACNDRWEYTRFDGRVVATGIAPRGETTHVGCRVVGAPKRRGLLGKWRSYRELSELAASLEADVYHAHEPDLALAVAVRAKALLRRRGRHALVVHDVHEYPPGETVDLVAGWLKWPAHVAVRTWDRWIGRKVDHFFTANSIVRGYVLLRIDRRTPVDVLYNGPALRLFPQRPPERWPGPDTPLVLCHEGSLGFDRGLREMVAAVDRLRDRVRLRIIGDVFGAEREWLEREVAARGLDGVITRTGWLPYAEVGDAVRCSHAGLILFRDNLVNTLAGPPNKLFNYMNAGLPVLSIGFPEMRRIIREERCGALVEDQTVDAIVRGIEALLASPASLAEMADAGQRAVRERYSWECMERILLAAYGELGRRLERA